MRPIQNMMGPSRPTGGVAKVFVTPPFHTPGLYNTFLGVPTPPTMEYCEIFRIQEHAPRKCPIMKKYTTVPNKIHCEFFTSTTHAKSQCRSLYTLADRSDWTSFRVNEAPQGPRRG
jgi:hypothetical protein